MCIKLYLCNGHACDNNEEYAKYCYMNGGECIHTQNENYSITKKFGDIFPKTKWSAMSPEISIEHLNESEILQTLVKELI